MIHIGTCPSDPMLLYVSNAMRNQTVTGCSLKWPHFFFTAGSIMVLTLWSTYLARCILRISAAPAMSTPCSLVTFHDNVEFITICLLDVKSDHEHVFHCLAFKFWLHCFLFISTWTALAYIMFVLIRNQVCLCLEFFAPHIHSEKEFKWHQKHHFIAVWRPN